MEHWTTKALLDGLAALDAERPALRALLDSHPHVPRRDGLCDWCGSADAVKDGYCFACRYLWKEL